MKIFSHSVNLCPHDLTHNSSKLIIVNKMWFAECTSFVLLFCSKYIIF